MSFFQVPEEPECVDDLEIQDHPDCCGLDFLFGFPTGASKTTAYRDWLANRKLVRRKLDRIKPDFTAPNVFVILNHYQYDNFGDILHKEYKYKLVHTSYNSNSKNDLFYLVYSPVRAKRKREINIRHRSRPTSTL